MSMIGLSVADRKSILKDICDAAGGNSDGDIDVELSVRDTDKIGSCHKSYIYDKSLDSLVLAPVTAGLYRYMVLSISEDSTTTHTYILYNASKACVYDEHRADHESSYMDKYFADIIFEVASLREALNLIHKDFVTPYEVKYEHELDLKYSTRTAGN